MIEIPDNIYGQSLICWLEERLEKHPCDGYEKLDILLLLRILRTYENDCKIEVPHTFICKIEVTEPDTELLKKYIFSNNVQVRTYCKDILSRKIKGKDKLSLIESASDDYLILYSKLLSPLFLSRAVTIRSIKRLKSSIFISKLCDVLKIKIFPDWMPEICKELCKTYLKSELDNVKKVLEYNLAVLRKDKCNSFEERLYIESLLSIGAISKMEAHLQKALSYENELNFIKERKKVSTVFINNVDIILNAYDEIYIVKDLYPDDCDRIKKELILEQNLFNQQLQQSGIKINIVISKNFMNKVNEKMAKIEKPLDVFKALCGLHFIGKSTVEKHCFEKNKRMPLNSIAGGMRLGDKGQNIGEVGAEDLTLIEFYRSHRLKWGYIIGQAIEKFQDFDNYDEDSIIKMFEEKKCNATYIGENQVELWIKGLMSGLNGDMVSSVHILTPQIERALVNKAESIRGDLSLLHKKGHQDEVGLYRALEVLKDYFKEDIYNDFRLFFNTGADVNLRNNVAHGLWCKKDFEIHGLYLWWIALKMFFCENDIFVECGVNNK